MLKNAMWVDTVEVKVILIKSLHDLRLDASIAMHVWMNSFLTDRQKDWSERQFDIESSTD